MSSDPTPTAGKPESEKMYRIKPLVWGEQDGHFYGGDGDDPDGYYGYTIFPRRSTALPWGVVGPSRNRGGFFDEDYPTLDAAKTAAEAHYRARLLTALEEIP